MIGAAQGAWQVPETLEDFLMTRPPTAERPLLGQTVLVVEDSRFACEALRLICQRSGARIRRADTLRSAARHLNTYRPGIVIVDLGLPDGSGLDLIRSLAAAEPRIDVLIATSGDDTFADAARMAGADAFMSKPITSVSAFQSAVLSHLPRHAQPAGIRTVNTDEVVPDRIALRDDLALAAELLASTPCGEMLTYVATFLSGVAKFSDDPGLADAARRVGSGRPGSAALTELSRIVRNRLASEHPV
jgi:CheY-like chemotaxis protein